MRRVLQLLEVSLLTGAVLLVATVAVADTKPSKPAANDPVINDIKTGNGSQSVQTGKTAPPSKRPAAGNDSMAIAAARSAVAEMQRLASTPEEMALAENDRELVEKAAWLLEQRAAARHAVEAAGGGSQNALLDATKRMQETEMSFDLQYLQLQSQMQRENRSYTAISNIMKTKHDTVKNSISNIR